MTKQDRSTVLIIEQNQTKMVRVNAKLLRYIKPTIIGLSITTLALGAGFATLLYKHHNTTQQNAQL